MKAEIELFKHEPVGVEGAAEEVASPALVVFVESSTESFAVDRWLADFKARLAVGGKFSMKFEETADGGRIYLFADLPPEQAGSGS